MRSVGGARGDNNYVVLFGGLVNNVIGPLTVTNVYMNMIQASSWHQYIYPIGFNGGLSNTPYLYIANITLINPYLSGHRCCGILALLRIGAITNVGVLMMRNFSVDAQNIRGNNNEAALITVTGAVNGLSVLDVDNATFSAVFSSSVVWIHAHTLRFSGAVSNVGAIYLRRINVSWAMNSPAASSNLWANQIQFFSTATNVDTIIIEHASIEYTARAQYTTQCGLIWFVQAATGVKNIELRHVDFVVHEVKSVLSNYLVRILHSETNMLDLDLISFSHVLLRVSWVISPASSASAISIFEPWHATFSSAGTQRRVSFVDTHLQVGYLDIASNPPKVSFIIAWIMAAAQGDERFEIYDSSLASVADQLVAPAGASKLLCTTLQCSFVRFLFGGYAEGTWSIVRSNIDVTTMGFVGSFKNKTIVDRPFICTSYGTCDPLWYAVVSSSSEMSAVNVIGAVRNRCPLQAIPIPDGRFLDPLRPPAVGSPPKPPAFSNFIGTIVQQSQHGSTQQQPMQSQVPPQLVRSQLIPAQTITQSTGKAAQSHRRFLTSSRAS